MINELKVAPFRLRTLGDYQVFVLSSRWLGSTRFWSHMRVDHAHNFCCRSRARIRAHGGGDPPPPNQLGKYCSRRFSTWNMSLATAGTRISRDRKQLPFDTRLRLTYPLRNERLFGRGRLRLTFSTVFHIQTRLKLCCSTPFRTCSDFPRPSYLKDDSGVSKRPFNLYASMSLFGMIYPMCFEYAEMVRFYHSVYRVVYHPQVNM